VTFVARVGPDPFGAQAIDALNQEGISTDHVVRDEATATGVALIVVDASGENAIAVAPGANHRLDAADVDEARKAIEDADMLLLQLEVPIDTVSHAATIAAQAGVPVILNPAPAQQLDATLLRSVTVLTPNRGEAEMLAGKAVGGDDSARKTAHFLRDLGARDVIVTLGAQGALVATERWTEHVDGVSVEAVDTTAAGDAFSGALAYALACGQELLDAVRFAALASASAVTRRGAQPSLPTRRDIETLAREVGFGRLFEPPNR
jgi:ribokinase